MPETWFRITPTARQLGGSVMMINRWLKAVVIITQSNIHVKNILGIDEECHDIDREN